MAIQEISAFSNFSGTNEQGYVIVGGSNGVEGGKKILSDIIPDPKTGSHNGHVLTYDSSEGIVWAAPQQCKIPEYTQADAGKVLAVKADGTGLEWISLVPANSVGVNNEPVGVNGDYFTVGE